MKVSPLSRQIQSVPVSQVNPINMSYIHGKSIIRIAMAEDHALLREALCFMINTWENCKVILQAENGKQLIERIDPKKLPDLVLIGLAMPEMNGYDTIEALKKIYPEIKYMAVSMFYSEEAILHLIQIGGNGFFHKSGDSQKFKAAVCEIMRTGFYFADQSAARLMKRVMNTGNLTFKNALSDEEFVFLAHIVTMETYKQIADKMGIPVRHTEYLRKNMFEHFDVQNRIGLAACVMDKGLVV
jgi:DNA-binding NarL/FixJ family response regulator